MQEVYIMAITHLKTSEFDQAVNAGEDLVVVDFFATWCGPCKMLSPVVERMAETYKDVHFYKVDIDEEPQLAERFRVMSVPTLIYLKKGQVLDKSIGVVSPAEMENTINKLK
ncbi:MAG: thioredoxin [Clostridiaceae bacterium]|nr:thioredoxin [Clostridium sp.]MDY3231995.1 thioredoxin [Clostridiaceae bacterium]